MNPKKIFASFYQNFIGDFILRHVIDFSSISTDVYYFLFLGFDRGQIPDTYSYSFQKTSNSNTSFCSFAFGLTNAKERKQGLTRL
jgi:hypothetical protein